MDEKVLKKVIKKLVRESLTEIFAEMKLESIVEAVVSKKVSQAKPAQKSSSSSFSMREALKEEPVSKPAVMNSAQKRKMIMEKMGVTNDSMWADIYQDTANSNNPILEGKEDAAPNEISENVLESMGLMNKDFSKHLGTKNSVSDGNDEEWAKKVEERRKMLNSTINR